MKTNHFSLFKSHHHYSNCKLALANHFALTTKNTLWFLQFVCGFNLKSSQAYPFESLPLAWPKSNKQIKNKLEHKCICTVWLSGIMSTEWYFQHSQRHLRWPWQHNTRGYDTCHMVDRLGIKIGLYAFHLTPSCHSRLYVIFTHTNKNTPKTTNTAIASTGTALSWNSYEQDNGVSPEVQKWKQPDQILLLGSANDAVHLSLVGNGKGGIFCASFFRLKAHTQ